MPACDAVKAPFTAWYAAKASFSPKVTCGR